MSTSGGTSRVAQHVDGHAGEQAVAAMRAFGVDVMFTLNGGHIWPLYEAARNQGVRVVDTRHEQSATFAAEAYAKLTRRPGVAALTAGPGITNGVSAITSAWFNGSPLVVLGGRAPQRRWGAGSLQELDHVPIVSSITKRRRPSRIRPRPAPWCTTRGRSPLTPHRGPVFVDFPLDVFGPAAGEVPAVDAVVRPGRRARTRTRSPGSRRCVARAERPAFIVGSDVYWAGAWTELARRGRAPAGAVFFNGLGRGTLPADHELAFLRTRGLLKQRADLVVVLGTPLDFRLGFGRFGEADGRPRRRRRRAAGRATSTS